MKKKVRSQPSNPFYSNEPAVSRSMIAGKALVPSASLANKPPKMVDKSPGRLSGVAGFASKSHPPKGSTHISVPGVKATPSQPAKLKMSGHSGAHRVGAKSKI